MIVVTVAGLLTECFESIAGCCEGLFCCIFLFMVVFYFPFLGVVDHLPFVYGVLCFFITVLFEFEVFCVYNVWCDCYLHSSLLGGKWGDVGIVCWFGSC